VVQETPSNRPAELPTGPVVSPAINEPSALAAIPATCPIEVVPSMVQMKPPDAMSAPTTIDPSSETSQAMPSVIRSKMMSPATQVENQAEERMTATEVATA
jgi:hypothetical protein